MKAQLRPARKAVATSATTAVRVDCDAISHAVAATVGPNCSHNASALMACNNTWTVWMGVNRTPRQGLAAAPTDAGGSHFDYKLTRSRGWIGEVLYLQPPASQGDNTPHLCVNPAPGRSSISVDGFAWRNERGSGRS